VDTRILAAACYTVSSLFIMTVDQVALFYFVAINGHENENILFRVTFC
jgi:hypothetical protein